MLSLQQYHQRNCARYRKCYLKDLYKIRLAIYQMLTLGLQEWFIILIDGNIPQATSLEAFGSGSVPSKLQCSIILALHEIWHICRKSKPPI